MMTNEDKAREAQAFAAWSKALGEETRRFFGQVCSGGGVAGEDADRPLKMHEVYELRMLLLAFRDGGGSAEWKKALDDAFMSRRVTRGEALDLLARGQAERLAEMYEPVRAMVASVKDARGPIQWAMRQAVRDAMKKGGEEDYAVKAVANARQALAQVEEASALLASLGDKASYRVQAQHDGRTTDGCSAMDGKEFWVRDAVVGVNFPPFHRGCRCTVGTVSGIVFTGRDPRPTSTPEPTPTPTARPTPTPEPVSTPEPTNAHGVAWALANAEDEDFWKVDENRLAFEAMMQGVVDGSVSVEAGDLEALREAARQSQLGRTLKTLKDYTSGTWTTPGEMLREQKQHGLSEEEIDAIDACWREIEDGRIRESWYKDSSTSAANKLARVLHGEQDAVMYNQVESFYVVVTRLLHERDFADTYKGVVTADRQFTTYHFAKDNTRDKVLASKENLELCSDVWANAKLLACYAELIFGEKTKEELIEEYRQETGDEDGSMEDVRAYYMRKLSALPDVHGLPIGFFKREETNFQGGGAAHQVKYSDGVEKSVNVFYNYFNDD